MSAEAASGLKKTSTSAPLSVAKSGVFSRRGDYWTIGLGDTRFPIKDIKGLGYIQRLLQHPGREFHALDLLSIAEPSTIKADMVVGPEETLPVGITIRRGLSGDAGEMLDAQAKREYQRRLHELTELLEDQRDRGNHERADQIESEIDDLNHEIRRGLGIGRRDRRAGSNAERARLNVTRAIKTALEKISESDGESGNLLERSIRTGSFCSYVPGPELQVIWEFSAEGVTAAHESSTTEQKATHREFAAAHAAEELIRAGRFLWVLDNAPFIGRDPQRSTLSHNLELARSGRGRLVTIAGEAGVGKTRLSREFCASASEAGFLAMAGACYDGQDGVPFAPFVELLESVLAQSTPEAFYESLGPDGAELLRLMPTLAMKIPGISPPHDATPAQSRGLLFSSMVAIVTRLSTQLPLLMLIEDLHWADEGTLALVVQLARRAANLPVMIIANHRDEYTGKAELMERALYELSRLPNTEHIKLSGLPHKEVGALLQALSQKVPPRSLVEAMSSATEGNPLFVRELYEHLAEAGKLFGPDGDFRLDLTLEEIEVPEGIRRLLASRLSMLTPETRKILQYAATIGKSFAFDLLVQSLGGEAEALLDHLEKAEDIGLLDSALQGREARFYFSHELVRQVVLEEVSAPRAQRVHLKVADAIEALYAGPALVNHAIELAHHLVRAGDLADPDRSINYLMMAAPQELVQGASSSALRHTSYALELFSSQPESKRYPQLELLLQFRYGEAVAAVKGWAAPEAGQAFQRARALCATLGDPLQIFQSLAALCGVHFLRAEFQSALSLAREAAQMAERLDDDSLRIGSHWFQGCFLFFLGNFVEAREELERGVALHHTRKASQAPYNVGEDPATACLTYSSLAGWCLGKADWRHRQQEAIERARALGHPFTTVWTMTNLCIADMQRHEWVELGTFFDEGRKLAEKYGFDLLSVSLDLFQNEAKAARGQASSIEGASRMLAKCKAMGVRMLVPCAHTIIAELLGEVGLVAQGHSELDSAFAEMNLTQERHYEAETQRVRGELHLREHESTQVADRASFGRKAEQCFLNACETAQKQGAFAYEVRSALSLSRLWMGEGKPHEARKLLERMCSRAGAWSSPELEQAKNLITVLGNP